jgi:hypothetical protein
LLSAPLGRTILASLVIFWVLRLILKFAFFGVRHSISILFIVVFTIGALFYLISFFWSLP